MARVTDQSVPPELQALYAQMTSPAKVTQGPNGVIQLKKNKRKPKKEPKANLDLAAFKNICTIVRIEWEAATGKKLPKDFESKLASELIVGVYSEDYFRPCPITGEETFSSIPANIIDPNPPPYGFRTLNFMPTLPTYPPGVTASKPMRYFGEKVSTYFHDKLLVWRRLSFDAFALNKIEGTARVLLRWITKVNIDAAARGSRPMFSLNLRAQVAKSGGTLYDAAIPPIQKITTLYWRYKLPKTTAPFFHHQQLIRHSVPFSRIAKDSGNGAAYAYVLNASPRPMMGRGYNNNNTVQTSVDTDPELWEIRKCLGHTNTEWMPATGATAAQWRDVVWSSPLGRFVAVGSYGGSNSVMHSNDGINWTVIGTPSTNEWVSVCYSIEKNLFVAISSTYNANNVMYSSNGINWTLAHGAAQVQWASVCYAPALGLFCAVGGAGSGVTVQTSPDGINWTARTPSGWDYWRSVTWSEYLGLFVALGIDTAKPRIMVSPDGINWTYGQNMPTGAWGKCTWSEDRRRFVAIAYSGSDYQTATSTDGINWTGNQIALDFVPSDICYAPEYGTFTVIQWWNVGQLLATSYDGVNWSVKQSDFQSIFSSICFASELCRFVAVAHQASTPNAAYSG